MAETKQEVITIRAEKKESEGKQFVAYTMNKDGKAVALRLRQASANTKDIPLGVSKIIVEDLQEAKKFFYPTYYATFVKVAE